MFIDNQATKGQPSLLLTFFIYSSTLKMEEIRFSERQVISFQTIRLHFQEDSKLMVLLVELQIRCESQVFALGTYMLEMYSYFTFFTQVKGMLKLIMYGN
jgi:hypothetical protein